MNILPQNLVELDEVANSAEIKVQWTRLVRTVYEGIFSFDDDRDLTQAHYTNSMDFASKKNVYETILNALPEAPEGPYLEIGSGYGTFVLLYASAGIRCFGCEPDALHLEISSARKRATGNSSTLFQQAVGETLPYRDNAFGLVLLDNEIEHVNDLDDVLAEAWRVLKPGGVIFLVAPNYASFRREAHYGLPWLPLFPRSLARRYVERFRGNTAFLDTLNYTTNWGVRRRIKKLGGGFIWPTIEKIRKPGNCSNPLKRKLFELARKFRLTTPLVRAEWLRQADPLSRRIELLVQKPMSQSGPRLLCLPADDPDSLVRLGVGSFIWNHYAPRNLFDRVRFAFLGTDYTDRKLDGGRFITVFPKRFGNAKWVKGICYIFRVPYFALRLARTIRQDGVDAIRARSLGFNAAAAVLAAKLTGRPSAVSIHAPYAADRHYAPKPFFADLEERILEQFCLRFADRLYCVSSAMTEYAVRMGAERVKTRVLHNRVNLTKFRERDETKERVFREKLQFNANDIVAITIGRLVPQKDPITFLKTLKQLVDANDNWKLIVVGVGSLEPQVRAYIKEHNLEQHVRLLGNVSNDDLPSYFHISDVFILSALYEGFGIVLIEAQAAGIPVVATRISGTADVVTDENAFLVPVGDVDSMANAMTEAVELTALSEQKKASAHADVARFDEAEITKAEMNDYIDWLPHLFAATSGDNSQKKDPK
ncbi:MAG: glycosyltransferase [Candidatus Latescibacterota bacterium]|nr:glycosyltransferase [Candidatus Latescibacterota bacterium]